MAKSAQVKPVAFNTQTLLQLGLGLFFFILGLFGLLPSVQESVFSLSDSNLALELIFGLIEIACGVILIVGLFLYGQRKLLSMASLIVFIFWAARVFVSKFVFGLKMVNGNLRFSGGFAQWLLVLILELILLICIWNVRDKYVK